MSQKWVWWEACLALLLVFVGQIALLEDIYSETYDEHAHISEALIWLESGSYLVDGFQSPLPRLAFAMGPRMAGYDSSLPWFSQDYAEQDPTSYERSLWLARLGTLPFAFLMFGTVALWSRHLLGTGPSLAALTLLTFEPTVVGHSALATLDVPGAAGYLIAMVAFWNWMRRPSYASAALAGAGLGFAQMCKFSAFGFAVVPFIFVFYCLVSRLRIRAVLPQLVTFAVMCFVVIWASYGFDIGEIHSYRHDQMASTPAELAIGTRLQGVTAPAPRFWTGFVDMTYLQQQGHPAFLLGEASETGWWLYFPVTLLLKATPSLLILSIWGGVAAFRKPRSSALMLIVFAAAGILLVSLSSRVDIGVRHLAPMFPLLAILGGSVFLHLRLRSVAGLLALGLIGWQVAESLAVFPDDIAYFTPGFRAKDYHYLSDSNLAWGQDRKRLVQWRIDHPDRDVYVWRAEDNGPWQVAGLENGSADAEWLILDTTMVAILLANENEGELETLVQSPPAERIGRSILIYRWHPAR